MYALDKIAIDLFGSKENLVEKALTHELEEVEHTNASFEVKYRMPFTKFSAGLKTRKDRHTYEIETDFIEWEASEKRREQLLKALQSV